MSDQLLHIISFIVHVRPDALTQTTAWITQNTVGEVRGEDAAGKLVVVAEHTDEQQLLALMDHVREQPGVIDAAFVYHEVVDAQAADEPHVQEGEQ
ncbi:MULTISPECIES: chaperone NapD [unclassified Halomonas]|uniref:chaperone NapD n=1 Tax=unclassified Halomonas TaxID=2609666 RepID=UPI000BC2FDCF|nr:MULTISPECIES: chaperone NapD [unclassified Halomonas]ATH77206.1 glutamate synthase [Halomonas hydrothermalis]NGO88923.1 glutamate synthase [Halomonas sp.]